MTPKQIGQAYDKITHLWESDEFDLSNGIAQHQHALSFAANYHRALDAGCGCTNRIINLLSAHFEFVEGLDISAKMLDIARAKRPDITFHHVDFLQWRTAYQYDFISCWDAFWHIPLADQTEALTKILDLLAPGGVCIFSFGGLEEPDSHNNDYMGVEMAYATLGIKGYRRIISECRCIEQTLEFDQNGEKYCYMIIQKPR
ncbi:MAG: methyltransferase domain-containing protein [Alteromonadaceae bacterium]|nr:methyltransferase domain-containing protein [Alteromonadaceae bacterium]